MPNTRLSLQGDKVQTTIDALKQAEGNRRKAAGILGIPVNTLYTRISSMKALGIEIQGADAGFQFTPTEFAGRLDLRVEDGVVLIASDCHYWPGDPSTAHRALVMAMRKLKPAAVIMNGDVLDGATISRHPPINWEDRPSVISEIEACKARLDELTTAYPKALRFWTLGNHCARFESRLAAVAPEYAKLHGFHLHDHFPDYSPAWSVWINDSVVVKHRFKGGIHATHNNTIWAGKTMVTGHLHSLKVTPFTDYNGTRWGVDTGTLADPFAPSFEYLEDGPRNWRSGFVVLTFRDGRLMWPELVAVVDEGRVEFRGEYHNV